MKKKVLTIILSCLVITLMSISLIYFKFNNQTNEKNSKNMFSNITVAEISKERELQGLKFKNGTLENNNGIVTYTVTVDNPTSEGINLDKFKLVFEDDKGNIVGIMVGSIENIIKSNSSTTIAIESNIDLSNANIFNIEEYIEDNNIDVGKK